MENPFADLLKDLKPSDTRKLSFEEQCGFYAALRLDVPPLAVARAANLEPVTISHLNRAGAHLGGQIRYPKVVREYEALGHDRFVHTYLTPPIRERIEQALHAYKQRKRSPDTNDKGFNPLANKYVGRFEWKETSSGLHAVFMIELVSDRGGYFWRDLKPDYTKPEVASDQISYTPACELVGDPSRGPDRGPRALGFPTSQACFRFVKRRFDPTPKQQAEMGQ